MKERLDLTPHEWCVKLGGNNLIVDSVARLGSSELTRMGATEADMEKVAGLLVRAAKGEDIRKEVGAVRSSLKMAYLFE